MLNRALPIGLLSAFLWCPHPAPGREAALSPEATPPGAPSSARAPGDEDQPPGKKPGAGGSKKDKKDKKESQKKEKIGGDADDGKKEKGDDDSGDGKKDGDGEKPEKGDADSSGARIEELKKVAPGELDQASPRFISKEPFPFMVLRPGASPKGQKTVASSRSKSAKDAAIDGSRWGFVDLAARKKRVAAYWDALTAVREKVVADEKASAEDREQARKEILRIRALKANELKTLDIPLRLELATNSGVYLKVYVQDRPPGGDKVIRDLMKRQMAAQGFEVSGERPETARGKRTPGYTFTAEGSPQKSDGSRETLWRRLTFFMVPKPKGNGSALLCFECYAPKAALDDQIEKELEAFIRATQFGG
jgi:hypothetical protein